MMEFYIKVRDNRIENVKFKTFGCGAAIAVSSMVSEMAQGKTLEEAMAITNDDVAEELDGLPKNKLHCSNLGADALHKAIENYREREQVPEKKAGEKTEIKDKEECSCPYCEGPIEGLEEVCGSCHVEIDRCDECDKVVGKEEEKCPHCGATKVRV
jgi:nitrogen fixation NifU-like protein